MKDEIKIIHCLRKFPANHVHQGDSENVLYVPELKLVFAKGCRGTFGGYYYAVNDSDEVILKEMDEFDKGVTPSSEDITFEDVKEFKMSKKKVEEIVENIRKMNLLEEGIKTSVSDILKEL